MSENEVQKEWNWAGLDQVVLSTIFMKVGAIYLLEHVQFVCMPWRTASLNPHIWKVIEFVAVDANDRDLDLEKMTREAVDRSKGQMEELRIECFCSNDLLSYIADRSTAYKIISSFLQCERIVSRL